MSKQRMSVETIAEVLVNEFYKMEKQTTRYEKTTEKLFEITEQLLNHHESLQTLTTKNHDIFKYSVYFFHKETGIIRDLTKKEGEIFLKIDSIYLPNLDNPFLFAQLQETKLSFFKFCQESFDSLGQLYKVEKCFSPKDSEFYFNLTIK
jgi:hypothetical protein